MTGYCCFEHLAPLDAFLNTAMLLGGMGPVNPPVTDAGKLFAGLFALYAAWCSSSPRRCCSRRCCTG